MIDDFAYFFGSAEILHAEKLRQKIQIDTCQNDDFDVQETRFQVLQRIGRRSGLIKIPRRRSPNRHDIRPLVSACARGHTR